MSSIRLLKDHEMTGGDGKPVKNAKGSVISVPFGVGRELIRAGIGQYASEKIAPVEARRIEPAKETSPKEIVKELAKEPAQQPQKQK